MEGGVTRGGAGVTASRRDFLCLGRSFTFFDFCVLSLIKCPALQES